MASLSQVRSIEDDPESAPDPDAAETSPGFSGMDPGAYVNDPRPSSDQAAADFDEGSGHIGGHIRGGKEDGVCHLIAISDAMQSDGIDEGVPFGRDGRCRHLGFDDPRDVTNHADMVGCELCGERTDRVRVPARQAPGPGRTGGSGEHTPPRAPESR